MGWLKNFWKRSAKRTPQADEFVETFENLFVPRALKVLSLARNEAKRFHHHFVGTEHVLLGLLALGQGIGFDVLKKMGVDLENVQKKLEKEMGTIRGREPAPDVIPNTPRVEKVLRLAVKEAKSLNHTWVGTEHILLSRIA
jgi:ATP-dependent Clp protease ATP-binding subunit ClpC